MSILSELQRIMELDNPLTEAHKKLAETYMFVNGELSLVFDLTSSNKIGVYLKNGDKSYILDKNIQTLDVWLPETGLYFDSKGSLIYVSKVPKRQWLRSYSPNFYNSIHVETKNGVKWTSLSDVAKSKKHDIAVDSRGNIWHHTMKIGYVKDSQTYTCTNQMFKQELIDWNNHDN